MEEAETETNNALIKEIWDRMAAGEKIACSLNYTHSQTKEVVATLAQVAMQYDDNYELAIHGVTKILSKGFDSFLLMTSKNDFVFLEPMRPFNFRDWLEGQGWEFICTTLRKNGANVFFPKDSKDIFIDYEGKSNVDIVAIPQTQLEAEKMFL